MKAYPASTNLSLNLLLVDASNKRYNAGPKARRDTALFLEQLGFTMVRVPHSRSKYLRRFFALYLRCTRKFKFPDNSTVWCQFPMESTTQVVLQKARQQGLKTVVFIHDIEELKKAFPDWHQVRAELNELKQYSQILSLNGKLSSMLRDQGIQPAAELECWDYHCESQPARTEDFSNPVRVVYAGNLSTYKSGFIYQLGLVHSVEFELFGQGLDTNFPLPGNIRFRGFFNPDTPPDWAGKCFGLVWDGISIDACKGDFGAYLAFNTPHKAALYFSRNLPVIVWRNACIAPLIEAHHAGLLVSTLNELESLLSALTDDQYKALKLGATTLGDKVRSGYFVKTAALKIVKSQELCQSAKLAKST